MLISSILLYLTASAFAQSSESGSEASSSSSSVSHASSSSSSSSNAKPPSHNGPCPKVVVDPLDYNRLVGEWYEVQRSVNNYKKSSRCHKAMLREPINNVSTMIEKSFSTLACQTETSVSRVIETDLGSKVTYFLPTVGSVSRIFSTLYMDYDDFLIAWSCDDYGNYHIEKSWVFSREPAQPHNIEKVKCDVFAKFNLTKPKMIRSKFANCDSIFCSYDFS